MPKTKVSEKSVDYAVKSFYEGFGDIRLYPDGAQTDRADIKKALAVSSKRQTGNRGAPDFIGVFARDAGTLLVIEDKPDTVNHKSAHLLNQGGIIDKDLKDKDIRTCACDGALHYAAILSESYNVIALGVSGLLSDGSVEAVDYYYRLRGGKSFVHIQTEGEMLPPDLLLRNVWRNREVGRYRIGELKQKAHAFAGTLTALGMDVTDRPLFVGILLIALEDKRFNNIISEREPNIATLLDEMEQCVLDRAVANHSTQQLLRKHIDLFKTSLIGRLVKNKKKTTEFLNLIREIKKIIGDEQGNKSNDNLGAFYTAFMSKSPNAAEDQQGLGIVLTPHHVMDMFPMIAPPTARANSIYVDTCCGTAGFLVSALRLLEECTKKPIGELANSNVWGVENNIKMYTLSCLNMILKGGDARNIIYGDSFLDDIKNRISKPPSIAFLNPPYTLRHSDHTLDYERHELQFVRKACDIVKKGGKVVALLPAKAVASSDSSVNMIKDNLLRKNTVDAVFKLSKVTFEGVANVETIIMVCIAKTPHPSGQKVYFGNWEKDGMTYVRRMGAVDKHEEHDKKIKKFVGDYMDYRQVPGESILGSISSQDEWLYQSKLMDDTVQQQLEKMPNRKKVARNILKYLASRISLGEIDALQKAERECKKAGKPIDKHGQLRLFSLEDIFSLTKGRRYALNQVSIDFADYPAAGLIPYVSSSDIEEKQGLNGYIRADKAPPTHSGKFLTINYGGGALNCFYREGPTYCTDSLNVAVIKDNAEEMDVFVAAYLKEIINRYKPCFSYNFSPSLARIRGLKIALPVDINNNIDWRFVRSYAMQSFQDCFTSD